MPQHKKWLAMAQEDLAFARLGIKEEFFSQACFMSQQTVEKCLKAFLIAQGRPYPKIHKVVELAKLCPEIQENLEAFKNSLKLLDEFYIPTRYPDAVPGGLPSGLPSEQDTQEALNTAEAVLRLVCDKIS